MYRAEILCKMVDDRYVSGVQRVTYPMADVYTIFLLFFCTPNRYIKIFYSVIIICLIVVIHLFIY